MACSPEEGRRRRACPDAAEKARTSLGDGFEAERSGAICKWRVEVAKRDGNNFESYCKSGWNTEGAEGRVVQRRDHAQGRRRHPCAGACTIGESSSERCRFQQNSRPRVVQRRSSTWVYGRRNWSRGRSSGKIRRCGQRSPWGRGVRKTRPDAVQGWLLSTSRVIVQAYIQFAPHQAPLWMTEPCCNDMDHVIGPPST